MYPTKRSIYYQFIHIHFLPLISSNPLIVLHVEHPRLTSPRGFFLGGVRGYGRADLLVAVETSLRCVLGRLWPLDDLARCDPNRCLINLRAVIPFSYFV